MIFGQIYRINFSDGYNYVGSTDNGISYRLNRHLHENKYDSQCKKRMLDDDIKYTIDILKDDVFFNKYDMWYWERIFTEMTNNTLNKRRSWRTTTEIKQQLIDTRIVSNKKYREKNNDAIKEFKNRKCICEVCGKQYTHSNQARHFRTH